MNRAITTTALPGLLLCAISAQSVAEDPLAALATDTRPLSARWQTDYSGGFELGLGWVSDDNFKFGQYNGLSEERLNVIGNLSWRGHTRGTWLEVSGTDLGLDTRNASINWGAPGKYKVSFELDSQKQVRNDSGRTPFIGSDNRLPADWAGSNITSGFSNFDSTARGIDLDMQRDRWSGAVEASLSDHWDLHTHFSYEDKEGTSDFGAAIAPDISSGHAAIVPMDVNYETMEFELGLDYHTSKLQLSGSWFYSSFDNQADLLRWQNPYTVFGPAVAYPEGDGGIAQAPDNDMNRGRLLGSYIFSPTLRFQIDGSYAQTEQDQNYADYTVNPDLIIVEPLPRSNVDATVETSTLDARVFYRPQPKLNIEAWYHGEKKDYDGPRDGYRPVLGDATNQVDSDLTVYNTWHDYTVNKTGIEVSYRLPWHSKLWLGYEYKDVERENSAVEESEEDTYSIRYRIRPISSLSATVRYLYGDRASDTYQWDQSYYARLDAGLINQTPANQRYDNHPLFSQYYLANRDRDEAKLDISWQPSAQWQVSANLMYRDDSYDKSDRGLTSDELQRYGLTTSWLPHSRLSISAWVSYDQNKTRQNGRSFRGGIEKNAFATVPPLPQASDPSRDWTMEGEDSAVSFGLSSEWQPRENLSLSAEYNYVDSQGQYDFDTGGASDLQAEPLPDNEATQHHLLLEAGWHLYEQTTIKFSYQYWSYDSDDWAIHDVTSTSIDKVLTLGEQEADEDLHYVGTSIVYRWR
jgi:MtrB/PioB family decaheme-associated outer membrane protein